MIELPCSARLALRPCASGWTLLLKADWSEAGRIDCDSRGRMTHLEIDPGQRHTGLGSEAFQRLASWRPESVPATANGPGPWLAKLGYRESGNTFRYGGDIPTAQVGPAGQIESASRSACDGLGICHEDIVQRALPLHGEPELLVDAGVDQAGRPLYLEPRTAGAWQRMQAAAADDQVVLEAVSGFRSVGYQAHLIQRKLAAGLCMGDILSVSAAPGFSEHHSGRALDLATPGSPPLDETFETTEACAWLTRQADRFGFSMTYPRDNRFGMSYEPWHWAFHD